MRRGRHLVSALLMRPCPVEEYRDGRRFTCALWAHHKGECVLRGYIWDRLARRPAVVVTQYCTSPRWFIRMDGVQLPNPDVVPDWSTCPGTLHEDFDTAEEACAVAAWWGFEPQVVPHRHPCPHRYEEMLT